jgi:flagellar biosynthetic protein FlhB
MADSAQDKRLPATQRKIDKARKEGQVARSRDLGHFAALGLGVALMAAFAPELTAWLGRLLADGLSFNAAHVTSPAAMGERLSIQALQMMLALLPLGAVLALLALASGLLAGGWNLSWEALEPKFEKVDPIAGFKRLFSAENMVQTLKACGLAIVLGVVAAFYLTAHWPEYAGLVALPLPAALSASGSLLQGGLFFLGGVLALFALVDVPLQRQMLLRRLRMSVEDVKKEMKDTEGNAEVKGQRRQRMRELAGRRMLAAVPLADLVVMNPSHYAVALKYDEGSLGAPRVVAKGLDLMAFRIRDMAQEHQVPVLQAPPLARALYAHCDIDQEIPARLFSVVAQVLAWVYQLRDAMARGQAMDTPMPDLVVPADMDPLTKTAANAADADADAKAKAKAKAKANVNTKTNINARQEPEL